MAFVGPIKRAGPVLSMRPPGVSAQSQGAAQTSVAPLTGSVAGPGPLSGPWTFLNQVARETGGGVVPLPEIRGVALTNAFATVLDDFRSSYVLHFTPRGVPTRGFHTLRVEVRGDTYTAYLNDSPTPTTTLNTPNYPSGSIGLYYNAATGVAYDNVFVQTLPGCDPGSGLEAVRILQRPLTQTVSGGTSVTLTVAASGSEPLSYQWLRNGRCIPGATSASHTFTAGASRATTQLHRELGISDRSMNQFEGYVLHPLYDVRGPMGVASTDSAAHIAWPDSRAVRTSRVQSRLQAVCRIT